jgi:NAD(P)-dependent dehydrogenase (short-subunit alcohol dehydrogenase family)
MGVVIIAGGATGIGRAAVKAFRGQGDSVLMVDNNRTEGERVAAEAGEGPIMFLHRDLCEPDAPRDVVEQAVAVFGALDTVFVTAAILQSAPLADWTAEMWDRSASLNLRMPFLFAQAAAPHLAKSDNGSIIFTSSTGALRGCAGMPAYHATKSGLLGLCRALTDELAPHGTRVNCILPGWIDTPFNDPFWSFQPDTESARAKVDSRIPLGAQGAPEDVAGTILFLASPASRYITGTSIVVDGGYTAV